LLSSSDTLSALTSTQGSKEAESLLLRVVSALLPWRHMPMVLLELLHGRKNMTMRSGEITKRGRLSVSIPSNSHYSVVAATVKVFRPQPRRVHGSIHPYFPALSAARYEGRMGIIVPRPARTWE